MANILINNKTLKPLSEVKQNNSYYANMENLKGNLTIIEHIGLEAVAVELYLQLCLQYYDIIDRNEAMTSVKDGFIVHTQYTKTKKPYTTLNISEAEIPYNDGIIHHIALFDNHTIYICIYNEESEDFTEYALLI